MRVSASRMARLKQAIDACPVRRGVLREAYEWFKYFGELPEDDERVAYEVVRQALRGGDERPPEDEVRLAERVRKAGLAYHRRERPAQAWPPTVRAWLFDEALFDLQFRKLARAVIATEVAYGGDVESPGFASRHGLPMYGSIAMHIRGWPKSLVLPPYEHQAKRLLVRLDNIRGRVPSDDDVWIEAQAKAIQAFSKTGKLPNDDLLLESVLAMVELDRLVAHKQGEDVSEVMALFEKVDRLDGQEGEDALRALCEMVAGQAPGGH